MKHVPLRTCIVCRSQKDKASLLRVVKTSDGSLVIDKDGRTNGRGSYVCKDGCMAVAIKKHLFNKAYKTQFPESVYESLKKDC